MNYQIIDEELINNLLLDASKSNNTDFNDILNKALKLKGLELTDIASLLQISDEKDLNKLFSAANEVKQAIYGNRMVLFAPLYISNYCSNNCLYCGFRIGNKDIERKTLTISEIKSETYEILSQGHKRVLMLMGEEHKNCTFDYFLEAIKAVYSVKDDKGSYIRRINIEIAPLNDEEFKKLNQVSIGTYTVFQETYHRETYQIMHPSGKKADYDNRIETMDRALSNGLHDVGIGALFGLYDYKFEVLALIMHAKHLDKKFNVGPHTISIPRIYSAKNAPYSENIPHKVNDKDFKKLVAILRLAVPYTGMILSTREPAQLRNELFHLGISQLSAGSRTNPGGYKQAFADSISDGQFSLNDTRTSGEVISDLIKQGFIPSFCTACYRLGRVGEDFMDLAKPGLIKLNCHPNGLLTLKEYLIDYADEDTRLEGEKLINNELKDIPSETRRQKTIEYLQRIEAGERDLYF
ncbi:[FeFe] hydrogenase H-cluster radical SAM maturase HydG [Bacteroidetes/Chlorobi group bacterium ChocPot_Mid]|nr:MAG: [FeFe] hydrogenase H-cluster radical SAM maturase HydG [Bacteroidetes/Chlorobi group bacterium ChocPot_Mid]